MPNVTGLETAPALLATHGENRPYLAYSNTTYVSIVGGVAVLHRKSDSNPVASYNGTTPRAKLAQIDGDTVAAVNAFLRPFGKVKTYWRTGEYRWHPLNGVAAAPVQRTKRTPKTGGDTVKITLAPAMGHGVTLVESVAPIEAPEMVTAPVIASKATSAPLPAIETVRTWRDRYKKQPTAKEITKTYSVVGDVLVQTPLLKRLDAMKRRRDAGKTAFGLITGPAGTAKTRLAMEWGFANDLPVVVVDGMSIQTATDWYGATIPVAGGFDWVWSDMAKLIMTGQPCLIVVDELNRPENERALNGLMPLTDFKGTTFPLGAPHALRLVPGQCIIATLNEGVEYVGTVEVDAAARDRFGVGVRMTYTSEVIEARILIQQVPGLDKDVAKRLVRVAGSQRAKRDDDTLYPSHNVISTRVLVSVAEDIVIGGLTPKEALWSAIASRFTPEDEPALNVLIEAQFGPDATPVDDDLVEDDEIEKYLAETPGT